MERVLTSDFAAARAHLDRVHQYLQGTDEISGNARTGLDVLIEAVITAQHTRRPAKTIRFPGATATAMESDLPANHDDIRNGEAGSVNGYAGNTALTLLPTRQTVRFQAVAKLTLTAEMRAQSGRLGPIAATTGMHPHIGRKHQLCRFRKRTSAAITLETHAISGRLEPAAPAL